MFFKFFYLVKPAVTFILHYKGKNLKKLLKYICTMTNIYEWKLYLLNTSQSAGSFIGRHCSIVIDRSP